MAARKKAPSRPRRGASVRARTAAPAQKAKPGRQPSSPLVVLYQEGAQTVCALIVHPNRPESAIESARGPYAALGAFLDRGYAFGKVRESVPDWARGRVPQHCQVLGCASITAAPIV